MPSRGRGFDGPETIPVDGVLHHVMDYVVRPMHPRATGVVIQPAAAVLKRGDVVNVVVVHVEPPAFRAVGTTPGVEHFLNINIGR